MAPGEADASTKPGEAVLAEWLQRLEDLTSLVKTWVEASGWRTRRITKTVTERPLGSYQVPILLMEKDAVQVVLNPVARYMPGADGGVDLYLAPAYDDIASLYFDGVRWDIHYVPPADAHQAASMSEAKTLVLSQENIRQILDGMTARV